MPTYGIYIIMLVAAIVMLWANAKSKSKGVPWGRPVAGFFGIVAVAMAIWALYEVTTRDGRTTEALVNRERRYQEIAMEYFGKHLAAYFPGSKAVLILPPADQMANAQDQSEAQLRALKKGMSDRIAIVAEERLKPPEGADPMMLPSPDMMVTAKGINEIMAAHPDANLFFLMSGLPMDFGEMDLWKIKENRPSFALANANVFNLRKAIKEKFINAVLAYRPDTDFDPKAPMPADPQKAFDERYVVVHPDNVDEIAATYKSLFMEEPPAGRNQRR